MIKELSFNFTLDIKYLAILLIALLTLVTALFFAKPIIKLIYSYLRNLIASETGDAAQSLIEPYKKLIQTVILLSIIEIIILIIPFRNNYPIIEIPISLTLTLTISWLASRICSQFLDNYLLDLAAKSGRKANSELFVSAKVVSIAFPKQLRYTTNFLHLV